MSRTEQLRKGGARERGGSGGGAPFVKWSEDYAFIEGRVRDIWAGKYGDTAVMDVTNVSDNLTAKGKDEDGREYTKPVEAGMTVNVGLNYASLEGTIHPEDVGKTFHVAFEEWGETKSGDAFRLFAVLEVPDAEDRAERGRERGRKQAAAKTPADDDYFDGAPPPEDEYGF